MLLTLLGGSRALPGHADTSAWRSAGHASTTAPTPGLPLTGKMVGIDPGHNGRNDMELSVIDAPGFNGRSIFLEGS